MAKISTPRRKLRILSRRGRETLAGNLDRRCKYTRQAQQETSFGASAAKRAQTWPTYLEPDGDNSSSPALVV